MRFSRRRIPRTQNNKELRGEDTTNPSKGDFLGVFLGGDILRENCRDFLEGEEDVRPLPSFCREKKIMVRMDQGEWRWQ